MPLFFIHYPLPRGKGSRHFGSDQWLCVHYYSYVIGADKGMDFDFWAGGSGKAIPKDRY
jgi:hypothetical protein